MSREEGDGKGRGKGNGRNSREGGRGLSTESKYNKKWG